MSWKTVFNETLENERVLMRPLQASDRAELAKIVFDPDIWRYFVARIDSEDDLDQFVESGLADIAAGRRAVFMIFDKKTGKLAGSMCFGNLAEADLRLEIGWSWLSRDYRGAGLNRYAKLALLTHAFEVLGCARVEFKTDVLNEQARKGLRNIGATEEGVLRSFNFMPGGRRRDAIFYSVLADEWPRVKALLLGQERVEETRDVQPA